MGCLEGCVRAEEGRHVCMCMEGEGVIVKIQWMNTC